MTTRMDIRAKFEGPIFSRSAKMHIDRAARSMVRKTSDLGEQRLNRMLRPRPAGVYLSVGQGGNSTGHYRRNLHTNFDSAGLRALITDGKVIYGPWLEGVSSRNSRTRFKGYASFRRTADWLRGNIKIRILNSEMRKLARKLGAR